MADLFQTSKQNIGQHLKNIFSEDELIEHSVVNKFFTTAADGKKYETNFCNLDTFLTPNERELLAHAGKISHEMTKEMAEVEYEKLNRMRISEKDRIEGDIEKTIKQIADGKRG